MEIDALVVKYKKFIKSFHEEMDKNFNDFCDKYRLNRSGYVYQEHICLSNGYISFIKQMANLCYGNFHSETSPEEIMKEWEEIRDNIIDKYHLSFLKKYSYYKEYGEMLKDNILTIRNLTLSQEKKYVPDDFIEITKLVEFVYLLHFKTE